MNIALVLGLIDPSSLPERIKKASLSFIELGIN